MPICLYLRSIDGPRAFKGKVGRNLTGQQLIFSSFQIGTNKRVRTPVRDHFARNGFPLLERMERTQFWRGIVDSKFVLSPPGKIHFLVARGDFSRISVFIKQRLDGLIQKQLVLRPHIREYDACDHFRD